VLSILASSPLDPLYSAIGWLLALFYYPFNSLGVAIILLTMVVMAVQFPLIAKQTQSMIQMQRVQPEIKKIQQKYKDDRAKQNEELLKFYQENKINPLAGCLPILITIPIGIAVFRTFHVGVQRHIPRQGTLAELYDSMCTKDGVVLNVKDCTTYLNDYPKGQTPPTFRFLGMNLNWSAHEVQSELAGHVIQWFPYFLLIALVIFTGWYQVRQTQARQQRSGGPQPNAQMLAITRIMPIFFGVITYGLNAATTLYFLVSNAWRIGQQHFVLNRFYERAGPIKTGDSPPPKEPPAADDNGQPPAPKAGGGGAKGSRPAGAGGGKPRTTSSNGGRGGRPTSGAARRKRKRKR
jgi:YidC/Oxa1 family membrane protein insertase